MANKEMSEEDVLAAAKERFEASVEFWSENYEKMREDIRFAAASPDDPWQWEDEDQVARKGRPMLTINKMPQHIRQVTNDIRQNRPTIRYRPADSEADPEVADMLMGLARHIEANSDADIAYDTAAEDQVTCGLGYIRVLTDYVSDESFDQDIFIGTVKDQFRCWDDPSIKDPSGADRKWFFLEDTIPEKEFKAEYPDADPIDWTFAKVDGWLTREKEIRVVEYFEIVEKPATLQLWADGSTSIKGEPLPPGVMEGEKPLKERKTYQCKCIWRKLNGQQILEGGVEGKEIPSKHIPFARVVGNEYEVDGKTYISGIVRNAKDSQRMYNVAQSAIVERVLLSPKAPWAAPIEAIEGFERIWQTANTENHSYLPYNSVTEDGNPIPSPVRMQPTQVEPGLNQIAMGASDDIKAETGQYDASLGQKSNETSGKAIMARQREGDNATYHYVDNLARAVRHVGRIILDMIPQVYDTRRIARIIGEDDEQTNATLDPNNPEPMTEMRDEQNDIQKIFNPTLGTYDVYTTTGPSFTTRRMEAVEAMTQMTQANPQLWQVIGDLLVKNMDWPGAEDMAKRLKMTLLPAVQEEIGKEDGVEAVPPKVQAQMDQMKQMMEQMGQALENASSEVDKLEAEKIAKDSEIEVKRVEANTKAYQAITDRLKVVGPLLNPVEVQELASETKREAMEQPDPGNAPAESMGVPEQILEMPQESQEPMPENMEPPGLPEPQQEEMPQQAADQAAFFTSEQVPPA